MYIQKRVFTATTTTSVKINAVNLCQPAYLSARRPKTWDHE